ncbi:MAG: hypothetical protein AAB564_00125 [Patescibacteria group bacterium]
MPFLLAIVFILPIFVFAQLNPFDIKFPISELGNCGSMEECKSYCDEPANARVCFEWAKNQGLVKEPPRSEDKFQKKAEEFLTENAGPGGCSSFESCDSYCGRPENNEECFRFAKEHGLMPPEELKRVERETEKRAGPGGCRSREECDAFCRNPDNAETCLNFAVERGDLDQEEADFMMQRMREHERFSKESPRGPEDFRPSGPRPPEINQERARQVLEEIGGPGGCKTMQECDDFCGTPDNAETCLNFAVEHNLMPPEEAKRAKNMMAAEGPGGCRGRQCEDYCENPEHGEECLNFAVKQGFMDPQEAERAKKFMELAKKPGPGGCQGKEQCDAFCRQPGNGEACMNFAIENGLMPPEEIERMKQEREIIKKLESQVEKQGGPGGCRGHQECQQYCSDLAHFDECAAFAVNNGMMRPDEAKMKLKEFIDVGERKFERFGPPGAEFGPPPEMMQQPQGEMMPQEKGMMPSENMMQSQGRFAPPRGQFGPPPGLEQKFEERFKMFQEQMQRFEKRGDYCSDPAHFEECRRPMMSPGINPEMMGQPKEFPGMPPREFPGQPGEFPGSGEFPSPERFREGIMPSQEMMPPKEIISPRREFEGEFRQEFESFRPREEYQSFSAPNNFLSPAPEGIMQPQKIAPFEGMMQQPQGEIIQPQSIMPLQEIMQPQMMQPIILPETAPTSQVPSSFGILFYPFLEFLK